MTASVGRLVVVATPIGNLADLSPRAVEALDGADVVAAEDTRHTGRLLAHVDVDTPQISYHDHNAERRVPDLVDRMRGGAVVALVTDAGTPTVSDPGYRLVRACAEAGVAVSAVPGPSAVLAALAVSGLPTDRFVFEGFLPRGGSSRRERLTALADEPRTVVVYLSPHRAGTDLADLAGALGTDRQAVVCRELTKLHEETVRGSLGRLAARVGDGGPRGEMTLVAAGASAPATVERTATELAEAVALRMEAGIDKRDAIREVAEESAVPKRDVYQAVIDAGL